jgi:hypothetical protein
LTQRRYADGVFGTHSGQLLEVGANRTFGLQISSNFCENHIEKPPDGARLAC